MVHFVGSVVDVVVVVCVPHPVVLLPLVVLMDDVEPLPPSQLIALAVLGRKLIGLKMSENLEPPLLRLTSYFVPLTWLVKASALAE